MELRNKLLSLIIAAFAAGSVLAESPNTPLVKSAFSKADAALLFEQDTQSLQLATLSDQEMRETEGAIAPLVYIGAMAGGRFIIQRVVTQKVAQNMVKRGATNVLAPNRSVAKNIAGRNATREYHPGAGDRYTHYHPNPRNGSHIWYGNAR